MKNCLLIAVLLCSLLMGGCVESAPETIDSDTGAAKQPLKGVSLSPISFEADDFTDFFDKAKQAGDIVMWAGDWIELGNTGGGGATVTAELASTYNYIPLIEAHFFTQSSGELVRPLDDATKQIYRNSAADFADRYKPEYLVFGIEVNALYEKSPEDFDEFVEFFSEVYDAVKATSPDTKVFTTFQLERMKGLQGGLFGGENDPVSLSQWSLLDRFPKSDLVAFTTYPCLIYKAPSEIPLDYYSEISTYTTKPVAFTEIGWFRDGPSGWESSQEEQAEFISTFFKLTGELEPEIAIWSFLYDQDIESPFETMGLLKVDETSSIALETWSAQKAE
ncbi:MAG TPA: hypothetical protein G4O13_07155 [Dehalococcoidia bacterium]|nr:hypothetical protein [Dehalococcoidia bacterium]